MTKLQVKTLMVNVRMLTKKDKQKQNKKLLFVCMLVKQLCLEFEQLVRNCNMIPLRHVQNSGVAHFCNLPSTVIGQRIQKELHC